MTRDDVIRWAREAGLPDPMVFAIGYERLVLRAAAVEREECAKVCDDLIDKKEEARSVLRAKKAIDSGDEDDMLAALNHESNVSLYWAGFYKCAAAIRARKP